MHFTKIDFFPIRTNNNLRGYAYLYNECADSQNIINWLFAHRINDFLNTLNIRCIAIELSA